MQFHEKYELHFGLLEYWQGMDFFFMKKFCDLMSRLHPSKWIRLIKKLIFLK